MLAAEGNGIWMDLGWTYCCRSFQGRSTSFIAMASSMDAAMPSQVGVVANWQNVRKYDTTTELTWNYIRFSVFILFGSHITYGMLQFTWKNHSFSQAEKWQGYFKDYFGIRWPRWVCYISIHLRPRMVRTSGNLPTRRPLAASVRGGHHNEALLRTRRGK